MLIILLNIFTLWILPVLTSVPNLQLNDGNAIPMIALGTIMPNDQRESLTQTVITAIKTGYRHINTAAYYRSEEYIGQGIADAVQKGYATREELFITTKLDLRVVKGDEVLEAFKASLSRLKLNYVDLFLIHCPLNAINPTFTNLDLVAYCQSLNIPVSAYAPFGFFVPRPFRPDVDPKPPPTPDNTLMKELAEKYSKSTAQITLRYLIDRGLIINPKSVIQSHLQENINIFDFNLNEQEIRLINDFNRNEKVYFLKIKQLNAMSEYIFNVDFKTSLNN
ncbi:aldo-keto reductase AKR2E4-like isoform X3 [Bicyclus anynana]|uniref:Aldo-keto reductase AKR2E4-like isoform X3 n=1 Tax=Bicyclus anynana TaxID=110368 RepID=A0ABM3LTX8_BICAN|nr:aldo-keto reductase AKR2E4-like isoform X3 [Bicyclus anynana]